LRRHNSGTVLPITLKFEPFVYLCYQSLS
jgi:hypothetical protein